MLLFVHRCAFLHFCSVKRPKLKQENPSLSVGAMARQLSSAWKLMTPEQKKPYNEMAERDKQRLVGLLAALSTSLPPSPYLRSSIPFSLSLASIYLFSSASLPLHLLLLILLLSFPLPPSLSLFSSFLNRPSLSHTFSHFLPPPA